VAGLAVALMPTAITNKTNNTVADTRVILPGRFCICGSNILVLGSSKAMHSASLTCSNCSRHCGWASRVSVEYVRLIAEQGRTTEPIVVPIMEVVP
jgi:hypothetical protein